MESNGVRGQVGIGRWDGANETFGGIGVGTDRGRYTRKEGVLYIDVIDPKSGHILWRGKGTHQVDRHWKSEYNFFPISLQDRPYLLNRLNFLGLVL